MFHLSGHTLAELILDELYEVLNAVEIVWSEFFVSDPYPKSVFRDIISTPARLPNRSRHLP